MAYDPDIVLERVGHIRNLCNDFVKTLGDGFHVDNRLLVMAINSAYQDIDRYKEYHLSDIGLANSVKRSAYLCKWLCKLKPIYEHSDRSRPEAGDNDDCTVVLANGVFALTTAQSFIASDLERVFYYTPKYLDEFQYDLLYRDLGQDALLHIFQNIYSAVKLGRAGVLEFVEPELTESVFDN